MSDFIDTLDRTVENSFELEVWDGSRLVSRTISHNGRVQAGGIAVHAAIFGGTGISFKYFALSSASGLSPANGDTTLASEITTLGLGRVLGSVTLASSQGSFNGTAQTVITATWTATGSVTIYGGGMFSAASSGTLGFEATCTATPVANTYTVNGTWTFNE
jgi:hypothetical protein